MKPGPDLVVACPSCGRRAKVPSLRSGNTVGARRFTDGKMDAPLLPRRGPITRCRACGRLFFWGDAVVGESSSGVVIAVFGALIYGLPALAVLKVPRAILLAIGVVGPALAIALAIRRRLMIVLDPSEADYLQMLAESPPDDRDRAIALRLHAWWAANDPARQSGAEAPKLEGERAENLRRLFEALDAVNADERVLKAEAARELGDFDAAIALLEAELPEDQQALGARILELARAGETRVAEVRPPGEDERA